MTKTTEPDQPVIVLVRPQLGENIGKAARAMLNFGLTEMRLVAPRDGWPNPQAGPAASGADVVLERARVFDTVAEAVADCPHVYATTHLANAGSLLLPVSNLNNLLAFQASGVSFMRFAGLMAAPWLLVVVVERLAIGRFFRSDLASSSGGLSRQVAVYEPARAAAGAGPAPGFAAIVVVATLVGFVVASAVGVDPAWAAAGGVVVLGWHSLARRRVTPARLVRSVNVPFLLFVLGLGVVVRAVVDNGLAEAVGDLLPRGSSFAALLLVAAIAAVLANVVNNLPAILLLLPLLAGGGPGPVLAALVAGAAATALAETLARRRAASNDRNIH